MSQLQVNIFDDIGGWGFTLNSLTDQLKGFKGSNIRVPINSYGGSVTEGIAIYNTLRGRSEHVETHIVGYAMSMGSIIAMAGDEVTMPEDGYLMIHNPYVLALGDSEEMERTAQLLNMMTDDLAKIYKRKTKLSLAKIKSMMAKETWLNGKQAKELGFVDRLTKGAKFEASFNPEQLAGYNNIPDNLKNNIMSTFNAVDWVKSLFGDNMPENEAQAKQILSEKVEPKPYDLTEDDNFKALKTENEAYKSELSEIKNSLKNFGEQIGENVSDLADAVKALAEDFEQIKSQATETKEEVEVIEDENAKKIKALSEQINNLKAKSSGKKVETKETTSIEAEDKTDDNVVIAKNATGFLDSYLKGEVSSL